ncbi:UDP-2,3-diacylglucosamine diphosphatase [Uliginosibacterium paludis]|uniref:UDP-2,3-diacylglucosamine diphosphatase n=1 Tax=Uliginosibacterium paludis TaxID=1615952 RepID=A0ABV2CKT8_9RHOO
MTQVRSIFLSDIHLGTRGCQADSLLDFLRHYEAEQIFLIGDIIDFWAMSRGVHWTPAQNTFVQKILRSARKGVKVTFIPGNHDEALREHCGIRFGDIELKHEHLHVAADGKRYMLIHGDEFDQVTRHHRWVALLGDVAYNALVRINAWLSILRRGLRMAGYWSLAGYAKRKVKSAVSFIFDFEDCVVRAIRERGVDGVICGHIHAATIRQIQGITYINCGDWVDSCTAIVEHFDGGMELVEWRSARLAGLTATPAEPQPATEALVEEIAASVMPEAGIALLQPEQHRH